MKDETGKIDIVYFNSREGYLRKLFPINQWLIISGKLIILKKYQITNPDYVTSLEKQDYVTFKIYLNINLTKGINEKKYRSICEQVVQNLPILEDWLNEDFIKKNNF